MSDLGLPLRHLLVYVDKLGGQAFTRRHLVTKVTLDDHLQQVINVGYGNVWAVVYSPGLDVHRLKLAAQQKKVICIPRQSTQSVGHQDVVLAPLDRLAGGSQRRQVEVLAALAGLDEGDHQLSVLSLDVGLGPVELVWYAGVVGLLGCAWDDTTLRDSTGYSYANAALLSFIVGTQEQALVSQK